MWITASSLETKVRHIVSDVFGIHVSDVTPKTSSDTVERWDSVNLINLMIALESEFCITLDVDEASDLLSVDLILAVLREKGLE